MKNQWGDDLIILPCQCGSEAVEFLHDAKNDWWYINLLTHEFYNVQITWWKILKHRIGLAWSILCGKEYHLFEVSLNSDNIDELENFIEEHKQMKLSENTQETNEKKC